MATIVNNPQPGDNRTVESGDGIGIIAGVIIAILLIVLFVVYGLPALNGRNQATTPTPGTDVNVTLPTPSPAPGTFTP